MYVQISCSLLTLWMTDFIIVGAPPYPGYSRCFMLYGTHDLVPLWALVIVWNGGKRKCVVSFPPSIEKVTSAVDAHVGTCHPSP